jgi:putative SOS response-associated peptidase YedK
MCNDFRNTIPTRAIEEAFSDLKIPLVFPTGLPNLEPREDIRITDTAPIVRRREDGQVELVQLRWSWPAPNGKPVYNFRSEGRRFGSGRCLIPADGFYEFTDPEPPAPKRGRKTKWLFTLTNEPWFCIAGLWRPSPQGDAFTMLTVEPGPDVAPYHNRQIVVLPAADWTAWLYDGPERDLLKPAPAGSLKVERVG